MFGRLNKTICLSLWIKRAIIDTVQLLYMDICARKAFLQNSKNSSDKDIEFGQYLDQEYAIIEPSKLS